METAMDSREIGRLRQKCFSFSRTLLAYKRDFRFSLRVGSFEMSLGANGASGRKAGPGCGRKRNPAYFRRQKRRRQAFLEKRGLARDSLGTGAETEVGGTRDGAVSSTVGSSTIPRTSSTPGLPTRRAMMKRMMGSRETTRAGPF